MDPTVITTVGLLALLAKAVEAAAGVLEVLAGAKLKLFTNDVAPGKTAVIGDFTLATFAGSAPISIAAWGEAFVDSNGDAVSLGPLAQWNWTAAPEETVYGVVLTDATDGLLGYARLTQPKSMDSLQDSLAIVPRIVMGPSGFGSFSRIS